MSESPSQFREYRILPLLCPFVKSIWSFEGEDTHHERTRERILPDACVELVIHFRHPFRNDFADGTTNLQPESFVVGQMKRFLEIERSGISGFVAVRFHARGAYLFLRSPLTEITNSVVPLKEIWNSRANEYGERVALARGMAPRVQIVEEMLLEALREKDRRDCAIERGVQLIQNATQPIGGRCGSYLEHGKATSMANPEREKRNAPIASRSVIGSSKSRISPFTRPRRRIRKEKLMKTSAFLATTPEQGNSSCASSTLRDSSISSPWKRSTNSSALLFSSAPRSKTLLPDGGRKKHIVFSTTTSLSKPLH
jgi:hypothetical protein